MKPPKCPEVGCGASVMRPKCLFELPPSECPRHELAAEYRAKLRKRETKMLKYFSRGNLVYLGDPALRGERAKLICTAESNRLAGKIASFMNGDTRKGRAHEYFSYGTGNPKRA